MNRRSLVRFFSLCAPLALASRPQIFATVNATDDADKSPHGAAVALVIATQQKQIAEAEIKHFETKGTDSFRGGTKQYWWHDTITRTWSATRPFAPGVIDSTHLFVVVYSVGDTGIARWSVDTRKRTAQLLTNGAIM